MSQLTGKADIYTDGAWTNTSQEGSSIEGIAGLENTPVMNSQGKVGGYTSKPVPGVIKFNALHDADFDIANFKGDGISLVFACDNGINYGMASATFQKAESLDAAKGLIAISYFGDIEKLS